MCRVRLSPLHVSSRISPPVAGYPPGWQCHRVVHTLARMQNYQPKVIVMGHLARSPARSYFFNVRINIGDGLVGAPGWRLAQRPCRLREASCYRVAPCCRLRSARVVVLSVPSRAQPVVPSKAQPRRVGVAPVSTAEVLTRSGSSRPSRWRWRRHRWRRCKRRKREPNMRSFWTTSCWSWRTAST